MSLKPPHHLENEKNQNNQQVLNQVIQLSLDLPSLMLISIFSAFSYYLSRLNLEVETILH